MFNAGKMNIDDVHLENPENLSIVLKFYPPVLCLISVDYVEGYSLFNFLVTLLMLALWYLIFKVPCPDVYRGKLRDCDFPGEDLGKKYAEEVDKIIKDIHDKGKGVCCFIAESMQSCGGQIIYPPGYLSRVYEYVFLKCFKFAATSL